MYSQTMLRMCSEGIMPQQPIEPIVPEAASKQLQCISMSDTAASKHNVPEYLQSRPPSRGDAISKQALLGDAALPVHSALLARYSMQKAESPATTGHTSRLPPDPRQLSAAVAAVKGGMAMLQAAAGQLETQPSLGRVTADLDVLNLAELELSAQLVRDGIRQLAAAASAAQSCTVTIEPPPSTPTSIKSLNFDIASCKTALDDR